MPTPPFRQEALDAAQRVEDLQRTVRVTGSATRLAAIAMVVALVGAVGWSFFVFVPIHVTARGVLVYLDQSLIRSVNVAAAGVVADIAVARGDLVKVGDVLAHLSMPDRDATIAERKRALATRRRENAARETLRTNDAAAAERTRQQKEDALDTRVQSLTDKLTWLDERLGHLETLLDDGVVTPVMVAEARIERAQTSDDIAQAAATRAELALDSEAAASARRREALTDDLAEKSLVEEIALLEAQLGVDTVVKASAAGRIASIDAPVGTLVGQGDALFDIEPDRDGATGRLEAALFVSLQDGKRVALGDTARMRPADLDVTEQARVLGAVRSISPVPVSAEALRADIGDDALVREIAESGPNFAVRVALDAPVGDPAGYRWTTRDVAPATLTAGTPVTARVTVDHVRLLALAIPALRRLLEGPDAP